MKKMSVIAVRLFLSLTLLTGVIYPVTVWVFAQTFFHEKANGQLMHMEGRAVGSGLIAQKFTQAKYFWPRPSAVDVNAGVSGGSNSSAISSSLKTRMAVEQRRYGKSPAPLDLLTASASGLDPHISPRAALYQVARVAAARAYSAEKSQEVIALIQAQTESRQMGFLGEPRVNVLKLNLALDRL